MSGESSDVDKLVLCSLLQGQTMALALVSCHSGGYKFALVLRCASLVAFTLQVWNVKICRK